MTKNNSRSLLFHTPILPLDFPIVFSPLSSLTTSPPPQKDGVEPNHKKNHFILPISSPAHFSSSTMASPPETSTRQQEQSSCSAAAAGAVDGAHTPQRVPFGAIQGYAPGHIPAYSNKHDHFFSGERHVQDGFFMGFKYQCVEFARRWLYYRKGLILEDISMAALILDCTRVLDAATAKPVRMVAVKNNGMEKPVEDALLIFPQSVASPWGHVAVITHVEQDCVYVADQNYHFAPWTSDKGLRLSLLHNAEANTWRVVDASSQDAGEHLEASGWMIFPDSPNLPVDEEKGTTSPPHIHPSLLMKPPPPLVWERRCFIPTTNRKDWLDLNNRAEKLFVEEFGLDVSRSRLQEDEACYYFMNMELYMTCVKYGIQLHSYFIEATKEVLADDEKLALFNIPKRHWPRIRRSFERQEEIILTGRFDFAFQNKTKRLVCFEYNADSASTLLECGRIQTKWGESVGLGDSNTRSAGFHVERLLRRAWRETGVKGRVHFCVDDDREEQYTAMICLENAEAVGLEGKLCVMFDEFHFDEHGRILDADNFPVTTIWKTWMWETAIADLEKAEAERGPNWKRSPQEKVRLCDLLLGPEEYGEMIVLEPMWKLIPSNKAILPLIYKNHPEHPAILRSEYELSDALKSSGYAEKPIVGRVGRNVTLRDGSGEVTAHTEGNFGDRQMVYQELFDLECYDGYYAIIGAWMIGDGFGGVGVREDSTKITGLESPFSSVRVGMHLNPKDEEGENE